MIHVSEPRLDEREKQYVLDCLTTGWISSSGRYIEEFERHWADYCNMKYGIAMSNGTVALEAAVAVLNLEPGDEVIMPSFTIVSCALAVVEHGGVPVLVDCDAETWCMNVDEVAAKITFRTRAIMPVHIYGHPVDMDPIRALAEKHHLTIIEDAAEAHGAEYKEEKCGSLGHMSCFSFYANKIITTGEGGMVLTNDEKLAKSLRDHRNLCFQPERRFYHTELGHNYRITNVQAAIGLAQIEKIGVHLNHKRWMAAFYTEHLRDLQQLQLPIERPWAKNVYWMYALLVDESTGMDARALAEKLHAKGVETRPFFLGMHEQPVFHQRGLFLKEQYPVTEKIARQGLYLPSGLTLTEQQLEIVCDKVHEVLL